MPEIEPIAQLNEGFSEPGAAAPRRTAVRVTDRGQLQRLAAMWEAKLDWHFEVIDGGFHDPAGRLGLVFCVTPAKVLAFGKSPFSQTRYLFTT